MSGTTGEGPDAEVLQDIIRNDYGTQNVLQSYDVLVPRRSSNQTPIEGPKAYWIIYIHGGYFRDIKVTSTSLKPAISLIEEPGSQQPSTASPSTFIDDSLTDPPSSRQPPVDAPALRPRISGYASLNYRLSPHPDNPQDPTITPPDTLNNARWPDHYNDIISALRHIQSTHSASKDYILVGHSVGATLALLATGSAAREGIVAPRAVVGVSGIYDFKLIHQTNPDYEGMTSNAMREDQYSDASPALYAAGHYETQWDLGGVTRAVVLAHSRDDGLVSWDQVDAMDEVFKGKEGFEKRLVELRGKHNEIWEQGHELVRSIKAALDLVD